MMQLDKILPGKRRSEKKKTPNTSSPKLRSVSRWQGGAAARLPPKPLPASSTPIYKPREDGPLPKATRKSLQSANLPHSLAALPSLRPITEAVEVIQAFCSAAQEKVGRRRVFVAYLCAPRHTLHSFVFLLFSPFADRFNLQFPTPLPSSNQAWNLSCSL